MALKTFNPVSAGLRELVIVDRSGLHKGDPVKKLTSGLTKKGGRQQYRPDYGASDRRRP